MKISIITMHAARNYGAVLQTYALQEYMEHNGHMVEIVDYRRWNQTLLGYILNVNKKYQSNIITRIVFIIRTIIPKMKTTILFSKFVKKRLHLSQFQIKSSKQIELIPSADIYCVGSDQVWNPIANSGLDCMYFWAGVNGRKISYASSIGVLNVDDEVKAAYRNYLSDFSSVSVREQTSVDLLNECEIDATCVLDPAFLLDKDGWRDFCSGYAKESDSYLLVYYFGNAQSIMQTAKRIAKDKGLRIKRIAVGFEKYNEDDEIERFITPERFIALFLDASFVITNSFHGTVFSINFEKEFLSYPVTENNARFMNILALFGLENRNLRNYKNDTINPINYSLVNSILERERLHSMEYLENAIGHKYE